MGGNKKNSVTFSPRRTTGVYCLSGAQQLCRLIYQVPSSIVIDAIYIHNVEARLCAFVHLLKMCVCVCETVPTGDRDPPATYSRRKGLRVRSLDLISICVARSRLLAEPEMRSPSLEWRVCGKKTLMNYINTINRTYLFFCFKVS